MTFLEGKKTIVVVGPGGVGKTTSSAAIAVHAAQASLKVLVLTVDPAKRLANALGLKELGNQEVEISPSLFEAAGAPLKPHPVTGKKGQLFGMMLDVKSTFDALIERHAPSPEIRDQILNNPFYIQGSAAMAGSQEYMAMEKLYEIREERDYDLIVLDTPPTANALDFLRAADRLEDFVGSRAAKWLIQGGKAASRLGFGLLKWNTHLVRGLNKFVGADMFLNLLEFVQSFHVMYEGFQERSKKVKEILRSNDVGFVIVSSTDSVAVDEAIYFYEQLKAEGMPWLFSLVNRVRSPYLEEAEWDGLESALEGHLKDGLDAAQKERISAGILNSLKLWHALSEHDQRQVAALREAFHERLITIGLFEKDVHELKSLSEYGKRVAKGLESFSLS